MHTQCSITFQTYL